jgi:hypothetical protein
MPKTTSIIVDLDYARCQSLEFIGADLGQRGFPPPGCVDQQPGKGIRVLPMFPHLWMNEGQKVDCIRKLLELTP